jgi:hypothetical protein
MFTQPVALVFSESYVPWIGRVLSYGNWKPNIVKSSRCILKKGFETIHEPVRIRKMLRGQIQSYNC